VIISYSAEHFKRRPQDSQIDAIEYPSLLVAITGPLRVYMGDHWATNVPGFICSVATGWVCRCMGTGGYIENAIFLEVLLTFISVEIILFALRSL